jgi:ribonuclease HI
MKIYADGGKEKYCFVIPEKNIVKMFDSKDMTNNEAEYSAVIEALKFVENNSKVTILSDSKLVVNQIKMEWHIKQERMREMFKEVHRLISEKNIDLKVEWVPREENKAGKILG